MNSFIQIHEKDIYKGVYFFLKNRLFFFYQITDKILRNKVFVQKYKKRINKGDFNF